MLWRPETTPVDPDECLWRRSALALRAHGWYRRVQPHSLEVTFEVGDRIVLAYAEGRVAGHAVIDGDGALAVTVAPAFRDRGIEDRLVAQATRRGRGAGS